MRRLGFLVALAVGPAGIAGACGDDDGSSEGRSAGSGAQKQYSIALVTGIKGDDFYSSMECGAKDAARRLGVDLDIQAPEKFDAASQTPIVNGVAARRPSALLIAPVDTKAMYAPIKTVADGGAKVVLVDTTLERTDIASSAIATDYAAGGRQGARILSRLIGSGGKVFLIAAPPGISTLDAGRRGFEQGVKLEGLDYVGAEIVQGPDVAKVSSVTSATLAKHPDLKGIFTLSGPDAPGVINALKRASKLGDIKVASYDAQPVQVKQLRNGEVQALVVQKPYEMGRMGVEQAVAALSGAPVKRRITTGLVVATKDNVDDPGVSRFLYKSC